MQQTKKYLEKEYKISEELPNTVNSTAYSETNKINIEKRI